MKKAATIIVILAVLLLASCSMESPMEALETRTVKTISPLLSSAESTSLSVTIASVEVGAIQTKAYVTEDGLYALDASISSILVNFPASYIESLEVSWFINGVETKTEADGSIHKVFTRPGYRDISCIATIHLVKGGKVMGDAHATLIQYPAE